MNQPLVGIAIPFHNTAAYLAQCIDSVLAQTYSDWECILVDNCSTDGSAEIAQAYLGRDPRFRLVRHLHLLSQVQNYNAALEAISPESRYCKILQADDFLFPEYLCQMVRAFEVSDSIGLVSSYYLKGSRVRGFGLPYPSPLVRGREMARLQLRTGLFVFGSPTTVMYRSSLVRERRPFYDESCQHEDTEACLRILEHWDLGFVHQVLSFLRMDNESISSAVRAYEPDVLDRYIVVRRYAPVFLPAGEAAGLRASIRRSYYRFLARRAIRLAPSGFWQYHRRGLKKLGEPISLAYLVLYITAELLWMACNPGATLRLAAGKPGAWFHAFSKGGSEPALGLDSQPRTRHTAI